MIARPFSKSFLALCLLLTGMAAIAFAATSQWQYTPTPAPGNASQLRGVDALSTDDAWSVGWVETVVSGTGQTHGLALRWNGTTWTQVPTPNPSTSLGTSVFLYDVEMVSSDDVWAVGTYKTLHKIDGFPGYQAFTQHWNGASWTQVEAPQTPAGGTGAALHRVDALSSDDVWAVGVRSAPDSNAQVRQYGFVVHWDGSRWTEMPHTPAVTKGDHPLRGVSALAPDQIWAAGGYSGDSGGLEKPYVNRWTGSGWELHTTNIPILGYESYIEDIVAIAPDDVWVVGDANMSGYAVPYFAHYDGASWQLVQPAFNHRSGGLMSVTAFAADDIWAAGSYSEADRLQRPLLMHYDGAVWTEVPADPNGPANGWFRNITAYRDAGGNPQAWAVGGRDATATHAQRLGEGGTLPPPPPPPATVLKDVTLNPSSITGSKPSTGTVSLNGVAPAGGLKVTLASANSAAATVPVSVTVPQGAASAIFTVTTKAVSSATSVGISASIAGSAGTPGETKSGVLTVLPPALTKLTLNVSNLAGGCRIPVGRITLDAKAPAGGLSVALADTHPAASVPAQVLVPAGYNTVTFNVTTTAVTSVQTGTVTATLNGASQGVNLTLRPVGVAALTLAPNPVVGPGTVTGTVTLECAAAPGSVAVALSSTTPAVAKPTLTTLTLPAGSTTGTFSVTTADVATVSYATIKAAAGGLSKTVKLTVNP